MMTQAAQLHTAARRYCITRHDYWTGRYAEILPASPAFPSYSYTYTGEQQDIFPRYNVLNAILGAIELFRANDFSDLADTRRKLKAAAYSAEDMFTKPSMNPI